PEPAPTTSWQTVSVGSIGNYDESCRDWITRNNQLGTQRRVLDRGVNAVGYFGAAGAVYENECVYMRESGEISKHHEEFRSNLFRPIDFSREDAHFVETQSLR
ncbi:MAG: hypothetical protein Q8P81_01790, partial [Nanoarchaeota archaeon]|nr:hypothetical protein [Nanoarchaeota archaeon]